MSSYNEADLVHRAQRGDSEALGALWDTLTPKLFGYLVNTLRDKALAEDILQATWLKAIKNLSQFKGRGAGLSPWLFAIAKNECRDHWRKGGRETPLDPEKHDPIGSDGKDVEEKVLAEQLLAGLSKDDQEILRLRYIADLPLNDIARVLNINFVTARVRIHRALSRARVAANN